MRQHLRAPLTATMARLGSRSARTRDESENVRGWLCCSAKYKSLWHCRCIFTESIEEGCIALSMTNSSPRVAPLWGKTRMLGTNPIACAFPGKSEKALVIDMATALRSLGKIEEFARKEEELDPGWAIDENGLPDTSPENVLKSGALVGLGGSRAGGGHKGTCLGILVDIFCGVMSGGNWLNRVNTDWLSATERGSQE